MGRSLSRHPRRPAYVVYEFPSELAALEFRRAALRQECEVKATSQREPWRITLVDVGSSSALDDLARRYGAPT